MKLSASIRVLAAVVVIGFGAGSSAQAAAVDFYLEIEGIPGESTDNSHKGWIDISSFSHDIMNTRSSGGGGGAGKVSLSDILVSKGIDKSSPKLMEACVTGKAIPSATLVAVPSNRENSSQPYMKYTLKDVLVSSYSASGASGDLPSESLSLNFTKIEWTHSTRNADGTIEETTGGWDSKQKR